MAKDPAFLFYSSDFLVGTITMDFEDRGKYITILCYMHQNGRVKEETIRLLVGFVSDNLKSKFGIDEDGLWYNNRLEAETEKRSRFVQSRLLNGQKGGRPPKIETKKEKPLGYPKGNLPINENIIKDVIDYLNKLYNYHEDWVNNTATPVLTINTQNETKIEENKILNFISSLNY
jgi:hypothetical protein